MISYVRNTILIVNFAGFKTQLETELNRYGTKIDEYTDASFTYLIYRKIFSANIFGTALIKVRLRDVGGTCEVSISLMETWNETANTSTNETAISAIGTLIYNETYTFVSINGDEIWGLSIQGITNITRKIPLLVFRNINSNGFLGSENNYSWLSIIADSSGSSTYGIRSRTIHGWLSNNNNNCYYFNENDFGTTFINPQTGKITLLNLFFLQGTFNGAAGTRALIDNIFTDLLIGTIYPIGTIITDGTNNYMCVLHTAYNNAAWAEIS